MLRFHKRTAEHQDYSEFAEFLIINLFQKYLDNPVIDFAQTSRKSRQLLEEKAPVKDFRKLLQVSRNTAASKIGNDVISLL